MNDVEFKMNVRYHMELWWKSRLNARQTFYATDLIRPGYDTRDEGPWHRRVALQALRNDYLHHPWGKTTPTDGFFSIVFRSMCPATKVRRDASYRVNGDLIKRSVRSFFDIPDLETCRRYYYEHYVGPE